MNEVATDVSVLVVGADAGVIERLLGALAHAGGCSVESAIGAEAAIERVLRTYEQPRGCPDIVVVDDGVDGAPALLETLEDRCPGVRAVLTRPGDERVADAVAAHAWRVRASFVA